MGKTTINKIVWSCDRCDRSEDMEISGLDSTFPDGWNSLPLNGKLQYICRECNESLENWFGFKRAATVTQRRVPPSEPFTKS